MNRRTFLKRTEQATIGLFGTGAIVWAGGCTRLYYAPFILQNDRVTVARAEFTERSFVLVDYAELPNPIFLRMDDEETFSAFLLRCTHRNCQPDPVGDRFECPCHGSQYDAQGQVLEGPAEDPLLRFATSSDSDNVYIAL